MKARVSLKYFGNDCRLSVESAEFVEFFKSDLALSVTLLRNTARNFYYEKSNYITSSYLKLLRSSRPEPSIFENFYRKYTWQSPTFSKITD